eukprot:GHUV01026141.1.p2 GENE.GHUV01026141.1~~GHUV01026141.1.p2  ORF type:complete len:119 (-),score=22.51 GHUV01026141.1:574-930(-)
MNMADLPLHTTGTLCGIPSGSATSSTTGGGSPEAESLALLGLAEDLMLCTLPLLPRLPNRRRLRPGLPAAAALLVMDPCRPTPVLLLQGSCSLAAAAAALSAVGIQKPATLVRPVPVP